MRQRSESELPDPPAVGSLWEYPAWTNGDYTGPWRVESVGQHHPESEVPHTWRIVLKRVELDRNGRELDHDADLRFWPGGWVKVEDSLLEQRIAWEQANPRPESLRKAERVIVTALNAAGFGRQSQVTKRDGFDIAVDDLVIRVEHHPEDS